VSLATRGAVRAAGLFLLVLGAKLWLIGQLGPTAPDWDQWGQEAERVYVPWLEGRFGSAELFAYAGVHQRPWSRLLALGLLEANGGQWDPQVQQIVGALLHAAVMAGAALFVARRLGPGAGAISIAVLAVCLMFPYSWRNTLWGFQSHIHILIGFSLVSLFGLVAYPPGSAAWLLGFVSGACAVFAAGSGFLAGACAAAIAAAQALFARRPWRSVAPTLAAGLLLVALGLALLYVGAAEDTTGENNFRVLRAAPGESPLARPLAVLSALGGVLGWPLPSAGLLGWLLYAPLFAFAWHWLRTAGERREGADAERQAAAATLLLALGLWAFLQALGLSALRSGAVNARHRDLVFFGPWVNALALLLLLRRNARVDGVAARPRRALGTAAAALFAAALAAGFVAAGLAVVRKEIPAWRSEIDERVRNLQLFLASDDPSHFTGKPRRSLPHPRPELLVRLLRDPDVRALLPPAIRDALPLTPPAAPIAAGWREGGVPPGLAPATPAPGRAVVGSWSEGAAAPGVRRFESAPLTTRAAALELALAGRAGPTAALRVRLVDARDGSPLRELPLGRLSERAWRTLRVRAPADGRSFRIEAQAPADPAEGWLALAAPTEVGPLGYWLVPLASPAASAGCLLIGAALLALAALPSRRAGVDSL